MSLSIVNRRDFLSASAGALATMAMTAAVPAVPAAEPTVPPSGALCGRVESPGLHAGSPGKIARGKVRLLDGRVVVVTHAHTHPVASGSTVLLVPESPGTWSILYAEA